MGGYDGAREGIRPDGVLVGELTVDLATADGQ